MVTKRETRSDERGQLRSITEQLAELTSMTVAQLAAKHLEVFGVPTRSRNRPFLVKRVAWRLQERVEGGLSKRAEACIEALAPDAPARWNRPPGSVSDRDPRLPSPGAVISRDYGGEAHEVSVLADGFEYRGKRYGSLSTIAKVITGTEWSGLVFFGLKKRPKKQGAGA